MKNFKKLILLLVVVFMVSGCVKVETNMKISMFKKMDFEILMAVDKSMLEDNEIYTDEILDKKQKEELTNKGFEIKKYDENNQIGNIISKTFDNIDYLSSTEDITYDLDSVINDPLSTAYIFKVEKGFLTNKYYAKYDLSSSNDFDAKLVELTFKVSLPTKALENNATSIDNNGKQLIWTIKDENKPIEFAFQLYNIQNVLAVILVIIIAILIILYLFFSGFC